MTRRTFLGGVATAGVAGLAGGRLQEDDDAIPSRFASAVEIDTENDTVTLPLYRGQSPMGNVFYVLFETTSLRRATRRGINWSPKLSNALGTDAVQQVDGRQPRARNRDQAGIAFRATPNFTPERNVVPGPEGFPLSTDTQPGATSETYTPLITRDQDVVYNAPHVANETGEHDNVVSIDRNAMEVTMALTAGFYEGQRTLYVSTEASAPDVAALEGATYAPALNAAPAAADRSTATSARESIIPVVNGPMGADNPNRQGLRSAVAGEGSPLNVVAEEQECGDPSFRSDCEALFYSPLWDVHPVVWTQQAIDEGQRRRLTSHQDAITAFRRGQLESGAPDGPVNDLLGGMRAAGALVNCPLILVG
ncbi:twin-arginine translocation signal domain-containing protein [Halorussus halophilus]|uniref:twin-arginine translocation signal domain-containing protein n=1 Tax=Halorussus halophilus TaxID=2650975 RepID=UPI001787A9AF|nr:twin-arginine translocation signal domain-containing protein [Halorussus halophilus]